MVNLEYYKVFYHVAKLKSITLAAEELFISQPAVSQAVKNLEKALGGTLFFRTPKGVRLTPEGELLYSYVAQGYEYLVQAETKYKELYTLETGEIRIGASDMTLQFYLLPFLERFNKLYPKIKIKVTNGPTPETLAYLGASKIDFGVVSAPVPEGNNLSITPVAKISDIFVAGEQFSALRGRPIAPAEIADYPIIMLEQNTSTRSYIDAFFKQNGVLLSPEFELATSELIVQFALKGLGVGCVVGCFAEKPIAEGALFPLELKTPIPQRDICIVTGSRNPISPAGKKLLDMMLS